MVGRGRWRRGESVCRGMGCIAMFMGLVCRCHRQRWMGRWLSREKNKKGRTAMGGLLGEERIVIDGRARE